MHTWFEESKQKAKLTHPLVRISGLTAGVLFVVVVAVVFILDIYNGFLALLQNSCHRSPCTASI